VETRQRILTGDRPTGQLHLGHYLGSLVNRVRLQHEYDTFILVADVQALTTHFEHPAELRASVREVTLDNLAVGCDPEVCTFVVQSLVPQIAELTVLFSMLTSVGALQRNPTIRAEARQYGYHELTYGFLGYPVSQAADITFCKAHLVPVGDDQVPHIELTREIVRRFNHLYPGACGPVFPEPQALVGHVGRLVGIDGNAKMSKSLNNAIFLADDRETLRAKVMRMYTDPTRIHATDPGHVEGNPVFIYHDAFNPDREEVKDLKRRYRAGKVGDVEVKQRLFETLDRLLAPIRERRAELATRPGFVEEVLAAGTDRARRVAAGTIAEVREAMGLWIAG